MAQKVHILLIDDIDGSDATETIPFAFDGVQYEIDLHDQHAVAMRAAFAQWADHARRIKGRRSRKVAAATAAPLTPRKASVTNGKHSPREMRDWARSNGFEDIPDRGRVPQRVVEAFEATH